MGGTHDGSPACQHSSQLHKGEGGQEGNIFPFKGMIWKLDTSLSAHILFVRTVILFTYGCYTKSLQI